jgi:hypothetical protein
LLWVSFLPVGSYRSRRVRLWSRDQLWSIVTVWKHRTNPRAVLSIGEMRWVQGPRAVLCCNDNGTAKNDVCANILIPC